MKNSHQYRSLPQRVRIIGLYLKKYIKIIIRLAKSTKNKNSRKFDNNVLSSMIAWYAISIPMIISFDAFHRKVDYFQGEGAGEHYIFPFRQLPIGHCCVLYSPVVGLKSNQNPSEAMISGDSLKFKHMQKKIIKVNNIKKINK